MGENQKEAEQLYQEARTAVIADGRNAYRYLPGYAAYETAYGTKQYYEDIFRKLKGVPEEGRDCWYLLALMETKDRLFEAVYEYQDGIRGLFKTEFAALAGRYESFSQEEKAVYLAAAYLACRNKTLLPYKYQPQIEAAYCRLEETAQKDSETWKLTENAKQCFERGERL